MNRLVSIAQMRALEDRAAERGLPGAVLRERAGRAVARAIRDRWPEPVPCLLLIGPGNNGGDGLIAARELARIGYPVTAYLWNRRRQPDPDLADARQAGVEVLDFATDAAGDGLAARLAKARLIVDCLLGIGHSRPIAGDLAALLGRVRDARRPEQTVIALDLPSGLQADTGAVDPATLAADLTLTLGAAKWGLFRPPGDDATGRVEILDIGIPEELDDPTWPRLSTAEHVARLLPDRPRHGHKGTFGRVLLVAGSRNYYGAATLAAEAAYRAGAGLVTLATPASLVPIFAVKLTEATFLPLPEGEPGLLGSAAIEAIAEILPDCAAIMVGPGLSREPMVRQALEELLPILQRSGRPCVLDADALNALADIPAWWERLTAPAVLTPHPAEFGRLMGRDVPAIQADRVAAAEAAAGRWGQTVVLKGAYTVIATPRQPSVVSPWANPLLASAGTGDVLSGIISGLLAQGMAGAAAAEAGVWLHAAAAEYLIPEYGQAGLLAHELLPGIPKARRELRVPGGQRA